LEGLETKTAPPTQVDFDEGRGNGGSDGAAFVRKIGFVGGLALFALLLLLPAPQGLSPEAWTTAAVAALMASWWLTEAAPISVTALLPLVLFPTLGVLSMQDAASPYANEVIFLFMGGFFLAAAMERWAVHKRIALVIMNAVGTSPKRLLLGIMTATAFVSMWISNTATTAMMLPIALAVAAMFRPAGDEARPYNFGIALMLGIAYASSIGGVGTLVGTAPNAIFAASALELGGYEVGFARWMMAGVPVALLLLPLTWLILVKIYPPGALRGDAGAILEAERRNQGPMNRGEKFVGGVFLLTVIAWILREPKPFGAVTLPGIETYLPGITDSSIAMAAALVLLVFPLDWRRGTVALEWEAAVRIPWGVLLLFGGGLSLASAMSSSGLATWIGGAVGNLAGLPLIILLAAVCTIFVFSGELTSNTAVTAMAMPVMAGVGVTLGLPPIWLMATTAIACSMGFMLPAGTPPNAIVFSSGYLTIAQMARAGIVINILSILIVTLAGTFLVPLVYGR
jgi:sodium-dependent dicarboxylate transporter 2/3/5